jgi:hypothetical protein
MLIREHYGLPPFIKLSLEVLKVTLLVPVGK